MSHEAVAADEWRSVADELAAALQSTLLRNPNVATRDWTRAQAALDRYQRVGAPVSQDGLAPSER
jgi:hypothetical protein